MPHDRTFSGYHLSPLDSYTILETCGTAEGVVGFEHDEALARALLLQVIGGADAGDAGTDDQHIEVVGGGRLGLGWS